MPDDSNLDAPANEVFADFKTIIRLALDRGLTIHPVKPRNKEPWLAGWPKQASRDPQVVQGWITRFPTSNYGVAASEDFCILESDNVGELQSRLSKQLPHTYTVQARPNRPHMYFKQTDKSRAAGNMDCPGIFEFKQNGRYVVGEGSIHPEGMTYSCIKDEPIAEIPDWLVQDLQRIRSGHGLKVSAPVPKVGEVYGEGEGRHPMLMSAGARMHDGTRDREQLFADLQALNLEKCDPPKTVAHVMEIVDWLIERPPVDRGPQVLVGKTQPPEPQAETPVWGVPAGEARRRLKEMPDRVALLWESMPPKTDQILFYEASLNQIFAWRGLGKTNLALRMAAGFATGEPFLDFRFAQRRVVYLDGELPLHQLYERADSFGLTDDVLLVSPENIAEKRSIDLFNPKHFDKLVEAIHHHIGEGKSGVLILDSQAMLMKGDSLSDKFQDQRMELFYTLRRMNLCVLEMHHSGKATDRQRGSSRNDDGLDMQIQLSPPPDHDSSDGLKFEWSVLKKRHNTNPDTGYTIALQNGVWTKKISDNQLEVERMLNEGMSLTKIGRELDLHVSKVRRLKLKVVKAGRLALNEKHNKTKEKQ